MNHLLVFASHLFPNYKNPNAGAFVVEQLRHLKRHCDITVLVPHPWVPPFADRLSKKWRRYAQLPNEETVAGIRVLHPRRLVIPKVNSWFWMTVSVTISYRRLLHLLDFDLVEGQFAIPDGFAAVWLGKRLGKPSLVHVHGTDVHTIPNESAILRGLVRWTLRNADRVRAVSRDLAERAISLGANRDKVRVIPNGVDARRFVPMPRTEAKERVGLDPNRRYLLYVGRLVPVKGLELLLDAAAIVMSRQSDIDLVLVGDGEQKRALQERAQKLAISSRTRFIGVQPHDRIPVWMNAGEVLCLLSHKEGMPTVLLESLACGTPVVATAVGGIPEIVADGVVGRLVRSRDEEEAANALREVLQNSWDRNALREYAMRFSYEAVVQQLLALYNELVSGRANLRVSQ